MTAAMSEHPPANGWTAEDLERFPDDNVRRELLDGVLLVSPSPSRIHQTLAARLVVALEDFCPPDQAVTQNVDVRFSERRSFAPDVLVITAAAADRTGRLYEPHELVLAAEIVSPTSVGMDRITKPAIYAGAGIPYYWRIETEGGIAVHVHRLDPMNESYQLIGTFRDAIHLDEPWLIEIPISRLTPPQFKQA
jgi:Uma2 family endonuclease